MADPEMVARAHRAALTLERAWERWRIMHGLSAEPMPPVSSYVGYSIEAPWGRPRVVFGLDASEAEMLSLLLDRHECVGPYYLPRQVPGQRATGGEEPAPTEDEESALRTRIPAQAPAVEAVPGRLPGPGAPAAAVPAGGVPGSPAGAGAPADGGDDFSEGDRQPSGAEGSQPDVPAAAAGQGGWPARDDTGPGANDGGWELSPGAGLADAQAVDTSGSAGQVVRERSGAGTGGKGRPYPQKPGPGDSGRDQHKRPGQDTSRGTRTPRPSDPAEPRAAQAETAGATSPESAPAEYGDGEAEDQAGPGAERLAAWASAGEWPEADRDDPGGRHGDDPPTTEGDAPARARGAGGATDVAATTRRPR